MDSESDAKSDGVGGRTEEDSSSGRLSGVLGCNISSCAGFVDDEAVAILCLALPLPFSLDAVVDADVDDPAFAEVRLGGLKGSRRRFCTGCDSSAIVKCLSTW